MGRPHLDPTAPRCFVCHGPMHARMTLCQTCLDFRALIRVYIEQAHTVNAASLRRLLNEARKP